MNSFERLEDEARKDGIDVIQKKFRSRRIKGLYGDGIIGINDNVKTSVEKTCVLSEELGHHHTSVGNIIDMTSAGNRKQERQASFLPSAVPGLRQEPGGRGKDARDAFLRWLHLYGSAGGGGYHPGEYLLLYRGRQG